MTILNRYLLYFVASLPLLLVVGCLTSTVCISGYGYDANGTCVQKTRNDASADGGTGGSGGIGLELCDPAGDQGPDVVDCSMLEDPASDCPTCLLNFASGTFDRNSLATLFFNRCFERYTIDERRLLSDGSIYVEGQRTNYVKNSNKPSNWSKYAEADAINYTPGAPLADGQPQRTYFGSDSTQTSRFAQSSTPLDDPTISTIFHRHPTGVDSVFRLDLLDAGVQYNYTQKQISSSNNWKREEILVTPVNSSAQRIRLQRPASAPDPLCDEVGEERIPGPIVFGAQTETLHRKYDPVASQPRPPILTFPSQLIETTGTPATRNGDVLEFTDLSVVELAKFDQPWQITVWPAFATADLLSDSQSTQIIVSFEDQNANKKKTLRVNRVSGSGDAQFILQANDVYLAVKGSNLNWNRGDQITISVDPPSRSMMVEVISNGSPTIGSATDSGSMTLSNADRIRIGSESVRNNKSATEHHFFGRISPPRSYAP